MVVPVVLANLPASDTKTLRDLFANGAEIACAGDVFNNNGATVLCLGEIVDEMEVGGTYWIPSLTLTVVAQQPPGVQGLSVSVSGTASATARRPQQYPSTVAVAGRGTATVTLTEVP
jgi:hypothetical protein